MLQANFSSEGNTTVTTNKTWNQTKNDFCNSYAFMSTDIDLLYLAINCWNALVALKLQELVN